MYQSYIGKRMWTHRLNDAGITKVASRNWNLVGYIARLVIGVWAVVGPTA